MDLPKIIDIPVVEMPHQKNIKARVNKVEFHEDFIVQEHDLFADEPFTDEDGNVDESRDWERIRSCLTVKLKRSAIVGCEIVYLKSTKVWKINIIATGGSTYFLFATKKESEELFNTLNTYIFYDRTRNTTDTGDTGGARGRSEG